MDVQGESTREVLAHTCIRPLNSVRMERTTARRASRPRTGPADTVHWVLSGATSRFPVGDASAKIPGAGECRVGLEVGRLEASARSDSLPAGTASRLAQSPHLFMIGMKRGRYW
jgi:hypothetical protein